MPGGVLRPRADDKSDTAATESAGSAKKPSASSPTNGTAPGRLPRKVRTRANVACALGDRVQQKLCRSTTCR